MSRCVLLCVCSSSAIISMFLLCYMSVTPAPHHEQVARALIEAGADLEKVNKDSFTALMISAQNGHGTEVCAVMSSPPAPSYLFFRRARCLLHLPLITSRLPACCSWLGRPFNIARMVSPR